MEECKIERTRIEELESAYDNLIVIAKQVFSASPLLIYILDLLRIPLKDSFNSYFSHFVDESVDEILTDEDNFVDVIHALRGKDCLLKEFVVIVVFYRYNLSK